MKRKLLITRVLPERVVGAARQHFEVTVRDDPAPMTRSEMVVALQTYDAILPTLGDSLDAETFAQAHGQRCRMLANFGVGHNHIDIAAARQAGMEVSNTPGAVTDATADIAIMLMLMAARRASEGEALVRAGKWKGWQPTQLLGLHVTGKTAGIIGMGRIGRAIARRCHAGFGMDIVFHNRSQVKDAGVPARQLDSLNTVMRSADVVFLAVPGGPATHHLVGAAELAAMQPHAVFINISRGDTVDEASLIRALEGGSIASAGLDVYEHEPEVPAALRALPNVSLLPHMGTAALEVREAMGLMAIDNLVAWAQGKTPPNAV